MKDNLLTKLTQWLTKELEYKLEHDDEDEGFPRLAYRGASNEDPEFGIIMLQFDNGARYRVVVTELQGPTKDEEDSDVK